MVRQERRVAISNPRRSQELVGCGKDCYTYTDYLGSGCITGFINTLLTVDIVRYFLSLFDSTMISVLPP